MTIRAKSSKALGVSAVTTPTALIQPPRHSFWHCIQSKRIGSLRTSRVWPACATGPGTAITPGSTKSAAAHSHLRATALTDLADFTLVPSPPPANDRSSSVIKPMICDTTVMTKVPAAAQHANGLLLHRDATHVIFRLVCRKCQQIWFPNRNRTSDAEDRPHAMPHSPRCLHCAGYIQMLPRNAGRGLIWLYRHTLSPLVGYNCRHLPMLGLWRRGHRPVRAVGRRLDDAGAIAALPAVGHIRYR